MHVVAHPPADYDGALIAAVDLAAELITDWRHPHRERHVNGHSPEPLIYRIGRPPFTEAVGILAARHATRLLYHAGMTSERQLVDNAFRVGMGSGIFAARLNRGETVTFPPPRETLGQWLMRLERDLAVWLLTRLAVDPPPGDDLVARSAARHYWVKAQRFRRSAARRATQEMDRARRANWDR